MTQERTQQMLKVASDIVPMGIYGIEKDNRLTLMVERYKSMTKLKKAKRKYKQNGYKVYWNNGSKSEL